MKTLFAVAVAVLVSFATLTEVQADPWFISSHGGYYRTVWYEVSGKVDDTQTSTIVHAVPHDDVKGTFTLYIKDPNKGTEQATLKFTNVGSWGYGAQITIEDGGKQLLGLSRYSGNRWELLFRDRTGFRPISFPEEQVTREGDGARYIVLQRMSSSAVTKFREKEAAKDKQVAMLLEKK